MTPKQGANPSILKTGHALSPLLDFGTLAEAVSGFAFMTGQRDGPPAQYT